jgi:hypothetical protein
MERFEGNVHLPEADYGSRVELEIEWEEKDVTIRISDAPGGLKEWPGLSVQTFGPMQEVAFRTRGIPPLFTHWWHFARGGHDELAGILLALPDANGVWRTCPLEMTKTVEK